MAMDNVKVGFIGGGNMAYAIAKGLIGSKLIQQSMVWTSARTDAKLNTIWKVTNHINCNTALSIGKFEMALNAFEIVAIV